MAEHDESLLRRLRESVLRTRRAPVTASESTVEGTEPNVQLRDSVRQLARQRVGQALRQLRATCGLTYEQVQARTGLSQQMLYDVEYRDRRLTVDELRVLADCYAIGVNDILGVDVDL